MASLDDIKIEYVIKTHHILLLQDADVAIDVQVFQVLLPPVKTYHANYVAKNLLKGSALAIVLICAV